MNIIVTKAISTSDIEACLKIRKKVFIEGQNVSEAVEIDGLDDKSNHYLIKVGEMPVGTSRVRYVENKAKIERVAILNDYQGMGLGKKLMLYIMDDIMKNSKVNTMVLSSQVQAIPFYETLGFLICSDEYITEGIPHKSMEKIL